MVAAAPARPLRLIRLRRLALPAAHHLLQRGAHGGCVCGARVCGCACVCVCVRVARVVGTAGRHVRPLRAVRWVGGWVLPRDAAWVAVFTALRCSGFPVLDWKLPRVV